MLFKRVTRTSPEKIFVVAYNSYATASLTNGQAVVWDYATDADGVSVTKPVASSVAATSNNGVAFAGIAAETIAAGAYGLIQVYGYHSATRVRVGTGLGNIAAGTALVCVNAVFCLENFKPAATSITTMVAPAFAGFSLGAQTAFTTAAVAVFIKAL